MEKKKAVEDEHDKPAHVVVIDKERSPTKKDGPHAATIAAREAHSPTIVVPPAAREHSVDHERKTGELQREEGNSRLGRILAAHDHAENHAVKEKLSEADKRVSPIQLEQEKGKGHV